MAWRETAPGLMIPVVVFGFLGPGPTLYLIQVVFVSGGAVAAGVFLATASYLAHRRAMPRVLGSTNGWLRHLPASSSQHRRATMLALAAAQLPIIVPMASLGILAEGRPGLPRLVAAPVLAAAAALLVMPVQRHLWSRASAAVGACLIGAGPTPAVLAGVILTALADRLAGDLGRVARQPVAVLWRRWPARLLPVHARRSSRAIGSRLGIAWALSLVPFLVVVVFARNNQMPLAGIPGAVSGASLLAAGLMVVQGSSGLARRRPPWPWVRSLPGSCGTRVLADAAFLLTISLPPLAFGFLTHPSRAMSAAAGSIAHGSGHRDSGRRVAAVRDRRNGALVQRAGASGDAVCPRLGSRARAGGQAEPMAGAPRRSRR